jgi:hypothetical protein
MLDVHPPHHTPDSWRDFFIHIATITVGLLIAVGLEQTVEAIHHHHQREYLEDQMHEESERNLDLVRSQLVFATQTLHYTDQCRQALEAAPRSGDMVTLVFPPNNVAPPGNSGGMLVSPSRGTWAVAKAAGTVALLPAEKAKVYTRLDLDAEFEQAAEFATTPKESLLKSSLMRAHVSATNAISPARITTTQRDDLIFANNEYRETIRDFQFRLAVLEGALEATLDNIHSLEEMYPYQERAIKKIL